MRSLEHYALECRRELDLLNIPYAKRIRFEINNRAKTRWGQCCYHKDTDSYTIQISSDLLDERTDLKRGLKTTLHHELLHSCPDCMKHTGKWKMYAEMVNAAYGYQIQRISAYSPSELPGDLRTAKVKKEPRYILKCVGCGLEYPKQKLSKSVQQPERYRCGRCGQKLFRLK